MSNRRVVTSARSAALILALSIASHAATAAAAPFLPLATGNSWVYEGDQGGHQTQKITGSTTLHGRTVWTKHYEEGADTGLENFWLIDTDGSVLLAGFYSPAAGLGYIYEPPIRFLPVPPTLGDRPDQSITYHDYATDQVLFTGNVRYDVLEDVTVTVPAGEFHSYGAGRYIPLPGPSAGGTMLTLDGRIATTRAKSIAILQPTDWFSEGTGVVQYDSGEFYYLVSYGGPTPTTRSSWSAIKRLYR